MQIAGKGCACEGWRGEEEERGGQGRFGRREEGGRRKRWREGGVAWKEGEGRRVGQRRGRASVTGVPVGGWRRGLGEEELFLRPGFCFGGFLALAGSSFGCVCEKRP